MSSPITVVIPTSPIPIHPSTEIIEQTIRSIRHHLPEAEMWILVDGVREQMKHRTEQYKEYVQRLLDIVDRNTIVLPFGKHLQQAGMLKIAIDEIASPLLFFCEHDATIDDKYIAWDAIQQLLISGTGNTVRLYWNSVIHPEHEYLMLERVGDFVKTKQWSSWPHISRTDFMRRILKIHFDEDPVKMIETVMYSPVVENPWEIFKTWIYAPEPDAVRFHHLDGRTDRTTGVRDPGEW
jgi:hypothetical protein